MQSWMGWKSAVGVIQGLISIFHIPVQKINSKASALMAQRTEKLCCKVQLFVLYFLFEENGEWWQDK